MAGHNARGLFVEVTEGQDRKEGSFELFEVRYTTRGEVRLTAYNYGAKIQYGEMGRDSLRHPFLHFPISPFPHFPISPFPHYSGFFFSSTLAPLRIPSIP